MPEMAGVSRTRAAEETSVLASAAGASFFLATGVAAIGLRTRTDEDQKLHFRQRRTRSVHADSPLEHNAFSSNEGRHCDPWALGPGGKQTKGANGAAPSGRATSKHDKGAKGARRGWIARLPSPSEDGRLSTHFALVQDDCSIASQQFNLLTFGTIEYILFIRKSPSSGDGL
jgi:hypothetical protein